MKSANQILIAITCLFVIAAGSYFLVDSYQSKPTAFENSMAEHDALMARIRAAYPDRKF